jgi:hypothetical protein
MSDIGGIVALVVSTAAGSSVISTLITTYATQAGDRRKVRADVRAVVRIADNASRAEETTEARIDEILDDFMRAALLARLPLPLVNLFFTVSRKSWAMRHAGQPVPAETIDATDRVAAEAFRMAVISSWHPSTSRLVVWRNSRRYMRILIGILPELDEEHGWPRPRKRDWERELLRKEQRERASRRKARDLDPAASSPQPPTST